MICISFLKAYWSCLLKNYKLVFVETTACQRWHVLWDGVENLLNRRDREWCPSARPPSLTSAVRQCDIWILTYWPRCWSFHSIATWTTCASLHIALLRSTVFTTCMYTGSQAKRIESPEDWEWTGLTRYVMKGIAVTWDDALQLAVDREEWRCSVSPTRDEVRSCQVKQPQTWADLDEHCGAWSRVDCIYQYAMDAESLIKSRDN